MLADLGGPSGALIQLRNGTEKACGEFVHSGSMVEATATSTGNQIAVGDVDGDGKAEVVLTAGSGNQPIIRI